MTGLGSASRSITDRSLQSLHTGETPLRSDRTEYEGRRPTPELEPDDQPPSAPGDAPGKGILRVARALAAATVARAFRDGPFVEIDHEIIGPRPDLTRGWARHRGQGHCNP